MNKVAVVYSSYYTDVIQGLLEGIKNTIDESFNVDYFKVPGSWDIIYKTNTLSKEYKIFIAVGVICKGDTDHYEYISKETSRWIMNLSISNKTPIIFGVLTCENFEQVKARLSPNYAISGLNLLSQVHLIKKYV